MIAAAVVTASFPARADTPPLIWQGATTLAVQCLVQRGPFRSDPQLQAPLCAQVARLAARGAPMRVRVAPIGDPALLAPSTVTLLVHATVADVRGTRALAFSIRPHRAGAEPLLFATAPQVVALSGANLGGAALDAALGNALADTLPWQARPGGAQPLPRS